MGSSFVHGMFDAGIPFDIVLAQHLEYNLFPPVDLIFMTVAKQAICAANLEELDAEFELPNGKFLTAREIIDQLRLEFFIGEDQ